MGKHEKSSEAVKATQSLKERNQKAKQEQDALIRAAQQAEFLDREKDPKREEYVSKRDALVAARKDEREQLSKELEQYIAQNLGTNMEAYIEWVSGMMRILNACARLNEMLFTYNWRFSDAIFYGSNVNDVLRDKKISLDRKIDAVKKFCKMTGCLPKNFDPHFSVHATVGDDGRVHGRLYSGHDAQEVQFRQSVGPVDIMIAGYLKEKNSDYELVHDSDSPNFRRLVDKSKPFNPAEVAKSQFLQQQIKCKIDGDPFSQVSEIEFKVDPANPGQYIISAKIQNMMAGSAPEKVIIPIDVNNLQQRPDGCFAIDVPITVAGATKTIQCVLPPVQLTSQDDLDNILGDDFIQYCQEQINISCNNPQLRINLPSDLDDNQAPKIFVEVGGEAVLIDNKELNIIAMNKLAELVNKNDTSFYTVPKPIDPANPQFKIYETKATPQGDVAEVVADEQVQKEYAQRLLVEIQDDILKSPAYKAAYDKMKKPKPLELAAYEPNVSSSFSP